MPLLTTFAADALSPYGFTRGSSIPLGFNLISTSLLSTTTSTVTFSAIPANYTHLQLRIVGRFTAATSQSTMTVRYNGDTGANYGYQFMRGNGGTASSGYSGSYQTFGYVGDMPGNSASTGFGSSIIDILDYSNTSKIKTSRAFNGSAAYLDVSVFNTLWNSTAAINSIVVGDANTSASFAAGTRISLYGIGS